MPNSASGLLSAFGTAEETVYGTAVAVDRWIEFLSDEMQLAPVTLVSNGLRSGTLNLRRGSRRVRTRRDAGGSVKFEVPTTGFGRILKHILGGTPTIAQQGGTPAYLQTHSYGSVQGLSLTVQGQRRDTTNAVVQHFTRVGCKITEAEFTVGNDQILQCAITVDGRDESVSSSGAFAVGSPTYATTRLFHFAQGTLLLGVAADGTGGASVAKVDSASVKLTRPMKTDGFYLGTTGLKSEPVENDFPAVTGALTAEFDSAIKTAVYDRFAADTGVGLALTFVGQLISGAYSETLTFIVPEIHFSGETPKVSGPDLVMVNAPWEAAYDGTNPGIKVLYTSTDTTV